MTARNGTVVVGEPYKREVIDLVTRLGEEPASRALGMSRPALYRILAGLPVRRGTFALVQEALKKGVSL